MATALLVPATSTTAPTRPPFAPATTRPQPGHQPTRPPHGGPAQPARPQSSPSHANRPPGSQGRGASDAEIATHRFALVCLEVLNGFRPLSHLRRLVEPRGFEAAAAGIEARRHVGTADHAAAARAMIQIRRIRVCEPAQGVAEASVVFSREGLAWSMAIRLEHRRQRWLCTVAHTLG